MFRSVVSMPAHFRLLLAKAKRSPIAAHVGLFQAKAKRSAIGKSRNASDVSRHRHHSFVPFTSSVVLYLLCR